MEPLGTLPALTNTVIAPRLGLHQRWALVQRLQLHFWERWQEDYLHTLHVRSKYHKDECNLLIGDLDIVKEPTSPLPPGKLHGSRKFIRVKITWYVLPQFVMQTANSTNVQPQKLCLLPLDIWKPDVLQVGGMWGQLFCNHRFSPLVCIPYTPNHLPPFLIAGIACADMLEILRSVVRATVRSKDGSVLSFCSFLFTTNTALFISLLCTVTKTNYSNYRWLYLPPSVFCSDHPPHLTTSQPDHV